MIMTPLQLLLVLASTTATKSSAATFVLTVSPSSHTRPDRRHHSSSSGWTTVTASSRPWVAIPLSASFPKPIDDDDTDETLPPSAIYYSPNVPLHLMQNGDTVDTATSTDPSLQTGDSNSNSMNEYSFFDEAVITVRAGSGGQGSATYKKSKVGSGDGIADGGNGGRGGNVIMMTDPSLNTLAGLSSAWRPNSFGGSGAAAAAVSVTAGAAGTTSTTNSYKKHFRAENGGDGGRMYMNGRFGNDVMIRVPPGTVVQEQILDSETGELIRTVDVGTLILADKEQENLDSATHRPTTYKTSSSRSSSTLIVARGGEGGEGSAAVGRHRGSKRAREPPKGGERKQLYLTLKLVADVAIVAVPNAGKSTFLSAVTRAKPKIANYPFTTIIPNLGVWIPQSTVQEYGTRSDDDGARQLKGAGSNGLVLCDVPGLIAGAASGAGLGHAFLRHVERCHVIVHLIDATSHNPIADYEMLNKEILQYGTGQLATMPQVVVVNKIDAFEDDNSVKSTVRRNSWEQGLQVRWSRETLEERLREVMPHTRLMWMSAQERDGVDDLMTRLASFVQKVKEAKMSS